MCTKKWFKKISPYKPNKEEDATEFLNYLFNILKNELIKQQKHEMFSSFFSLHLIDRYECLNCHLICNRPHELFFLPLSLYAFNVSNIQMLFDNYFNEEILENDNKVFCSICKSKQKAKKTCFIAKSPEYLILSLNRFDKNKKLLNQYDYSREIKIKVLESDNFSINYETYELISFVIHSGSGKSSGHYYVSFKNNSDNNWVFIDDKMFSSFDFFCISNNHTPYILFYQRKKNEKEINQITVNKQISEIITDDNRSLLMEISNLVQ